MLTTLIRRAAAPLVLAAGLLVVGALPALAHADLVSVVEVIGETQQPAQLQLTFSEGIELAFSKVTLVDSGGKDIDLGEIALDSGDNRIVLIELSAPLPAAAYTIHWTVVSTDGHKMEGTTPFEAKP